MRRACFARVIWRLLHSAAPVTPAIEPLTAYRGTLTAAGAGAVNVGQLSGSNFTANASTYTLTSGTAGHWTTPTDGTFPVPTSTGAGVALNGGPYVFDYTSTNGVIHKHGTLTINTRANTYTASLIAELAAIKTAGIANVTVELAQGATNFGTATFASPISLPHWRATTLCTIKHENPAKPCLVGNLDILYPDNLVFDGIVVTPSARTAPSSLEKAWYIYTIATPTGTESTTNRITFNNCGVSGVADSTKGVRGFYFQTGSGPIATSFTGTTSLTWVQKAFNIVDSANLGITVGGTSGSTGAMAGPIRVRYWTADALIMTDGASELGSYAYSDLLFMSPMYDGSSDYNAGPPATGLDNGSIHPDTIQFPDSVNIKNVAIDTLTLIQADGDSISQTIFSSGTTVLGLTIKNAISVGRSHHALTLSGTDASHVVSVQNYTAITQWSGRYGSTDIPGTVVNPGIMLQQGAAVITPADITLSNIWMQGQINNPSAYTPDGTVIHLNDSTGDISATFPNAAWISSPTLRTAALANNVANYSGLVDSRWTDTTDNVLASVVAALTPASGQVGAVKSDGTRPLTLPAALGPSIVEGAAVTNSSTSSTTVSTSFTPSAGSNRRIVVAVEWNGSGGSAVTCSVVGGTTVAMTQIGIQGSAGTLSASNEGLALFELAEASWPSSPASITATVTHTGTPTSMGIEAVTMKNAPNAAAGAQSGGSANLSTALNLTVTPSAANSLVVGAYGISSNSSTSNWTQGLTRLGSPFTYPATPARTAVLGSAVQGASALTVQPTNAATRGMVIAAYFAP